MNEHNQIDAIERSVKLLAELVRDADVGVKGAVQEHLSKKRIMLNDLLLGDKGSEEEILELLPVR